MIIIKYIANNQLDRTVRLSQTPVIHHIPQTKRYPGTLANKQTNSFSQFTNSLFSTSRHHSRTMAQSSTLRQYRTIAYIVLALVGFWLLLKIWHGVGGGSSGGEVPTGGL